MAGYRRMALQSGPSLCLVSFELCPYVQRALIVAAEKKLPLERLMIDLSNKPDWFVKLSPTGKVPMLLVGEDALFESSAIAEFLDEISPGSLLPSSPICRARHRAWVEFGSATLAEIAGLYSASQQAAFKERQRSLRSRFERIDAQLTGTWFGGEFFSMVDAAFAPVMRYLDAFETLANLHLTVHLSKFQGWRERLLQRASVAEAIGPDYEARLEQFLKARNSILASLIV